MVIFPASISFWMSPGGWPFTVQPNEKAVPKTFHNHKKTHEKHKQIVTATSLVSGR